jgi:Glycosyl hydrolase catalytic core
MKIYLLKWCVTLMFIPFTSCKKEVDTPNTNINNNSGVIQQGNYSGQLLAVSKAENLASPWLELFPDTVYTSFNAQSALFRSLPSGSEDKIISFYLPKGFMAVFAANSDGTGESACFVAKDSAIKANLPARLRNSISYVRYRTINNPEKKGTASTNDAAVQAFDAQWYYSWGLNKASFNVQQYVPMTWGKGACTDNNVNYLVERTDIDHLLSFNEPDNTSQSNIPNIDTAVQRYKIMQKTGLRLGTPVVTQDQAFGSGKWLTNFMDRAILEKLRIDFIAVHWYDWGNQTNNAATDSLTAERVFSRFVTYIERVRQAYPGYPVWVTEYNANINRTSEVVHKYFMKLSAEWMNNTSYIERYSYFFPNSVPALNPDNTLTSAGAYWKSLVSAKSFAGNIISDAVLFK